MRQRGSHCSAVLTGRSKTYRCCFDCVPNCGACAIESPHSFKNRMVGPTTPAYEGSGVTKTVFLGARASSPRSQGHCSSCVLVPSKGLIHAGRSHPHPAGPEPHPLLSLRRAGPTLALRHADRPAVEGPGTPRGELLVQDRAHRNRAENIIPGRGGTRRFATRQRFARGRSALAEVGLAQRLGDDQEAASPLVAAGPAASVVLLPTGGGRDHHLS